jgi:hypothetical protein
MKVKHLELVVYGCSCCQREWIEELPPLWSGLDMWPACNRCGMLAQLIGPLSELAHP